MNNSEVYIVVEGPTEQTFVRDVLASQLASKNIFLHPVLIGKPGHKGGDVRFEKAKNDIGNLLKQRQDTYISTMFDYFRIDSKWPGKNEINNKIQNGIFLSACDKAKIIENATLQKIIENFPDYNTENRFIPYFSMHEFEALLFSDEKSLSEKLDVNISAINTITSQFDSPEEINENPSNAPSKLLISIKYNYRKIAMGKSIAASIGINNIRAKCKNFDNWISKLEAL